MAETWVTYNGVALRNVLTRSFEQEAVYDQSDTDLLYYKFTVSVVGYVYPEVPTTSGGVTTPRVGITPNGHATAGEQLVAIRSLLLTPRAEFEMKTGAGDDGTGGQVLLKADPMSRGAIPDQADLNNGPKPRSANVTQIAGDQLMEVEFTIEVCVLECSGSVTVPGNTSNVLNNRWSCVDVVDANFFTTRTFTGRLRLFSARINPQSFRDWVVPRLEPGFRRESMTFRATEDGLQLEYTIVDREIAFSAPRPATEWNYRYTEDVADAKLIESSIQLMLGTSRSIDKKILVRIGVAIIKARLFSGEIALKNSILKSLQITDEYGEHTNRIYINCRVLRHKSRKTDLIGIAVDNIGKPIDNADIAAATVPFYDRDRSYGSYPGEPIYVSGPVSLVAAWSAHLQTPCNEDHRMITAEASDVVDEETDSGADSPGSGISATVVTTLGRADWPYTSAEHDAAIYTHFKLDSKYQRNAQRVQLPRALQASLYAAGEKTSSVVGVGAPTWKRVIRVQAERVGKSPQLPAAVDSYDFDAGTAILIKNVIHPQAPDRSPEGKVTFRVSAEYTYAIDVEPVAPTLPIGTNPWEDPAFAGWTTDPALLSGVSP